jgi:serine/threonine protein kinase
MTPERWQQVRQVFDAAISLQGSERATYVERACRSDFDLRLEVESLLSSDEQAASGFLNVPAGSLLKKQAPALTLPDRVGRRMGAYQILEEIGHGGMGDVYRAARADGQFTKEVAIKLVRGGFDSTFVLSRFCTERQILATLDHPNIARLLDGGTTEDGIPYLVMELIEGTRIDLFCDERMLSITQRLRLFGHLPGEPGCRPGDMRCLLPS